MIIKIQDLVETMSGKNLPVMVKSSTGNITHITDDDASQDRVKTRCNRTLKDFQKHYPGGKNCTQCGVEQDFVDIHDLQILERKEKEIARKAEKVKREEILAGRMSSHRQIMDDFMAYFKTIGATDIDHKQRQAGGEISFLVDGLKFKLSGNIH